MEILLKEWFADDANALDDLTNGRFELRDAGTGALVHPSIWEKVVQHKWNVSFVCTSKAKAAKPSRSEKQPTHFAETTFYNHVQYTVSYYRSENTYGGQQFLRAIAYYEPVEFQVANTHEYLPALEERKDVISANGETLPVVYGSGSGRKAQLNPQDRVKQTSLKIHSPYLMNILRAIIEFPANPPTGDQDDGIAGGLFNYPYKDLYYHIPQLEGYQRGSLDLRAQHSDEFNRSSDMHIDLLLHYLRSQDTIQFDNVVAKFRTTPATVPFANLWLLMKPGTDVYVREQDGSLAAYILDRFTGGINVTADTTTARQYSAIVWNLVFNGSHIIRKSRTVYVQIFDNDQDITTLSLFPTQYQDRKDEKKFRNELIARGSKYFEFSKGPRFLQYTGRGMKRGFRTYKRERVVVEHQTESWKSWEFDFHWNVWATQEEPLAAARAVLCACDEGKNKSTNDAVYQPVKFSGYDNLDPKEHEGLTQHQYLLMSSHMYAFILKDRTYDLVDVDGLESPAMAEMAIDKLVMDQQSKDMIKAIAKTYTESNPTGRFSADFISGKGEGQILLLHGPPGTGKTLTAESVAEYTRRPLLSITAADLGHEPEALERNLLRFFKDANDWDAIVLLDEADVYLQQRSMHDLQRNSIVSGKSPYPWLFLRALDYFQGILFLTTNRVGQFDEAFMSRIHLSLGYNKLDDQARDQIWQNLFEKLRADHEQGGPEIQYQYDAKEYVRSKEVRKLAWNGREIRNAFQTAVALAVFDSKYKKANAIPKITENHLQQVVKMSAAFRSYMTATHQGYDDSSLAFKHGNREDNLHSKPAPGSSIRA
ncbi:P-loop containing nucleoside triphosphate hydrolase protein [Byssothecium circinans]|uniref:P-loop containing nucleoside triphosphate hydrolase protein n=1 Tax=Byssothecium circinans TaxID=147558 RepID=A0A6A5TYY3_9PLEO|nr:P-loop containing nucleoside triphosphate hydrolase protein [Byssothecium circinans]